MRSGVHFRNANATGSQNACGEVVIESSDPFSLQQSAECGQAFRWTRHGDYYYCVLGSSVLRIRQKGKKLFATLHPGTGYFSTLATVGDVFRFDDDIRGILRDLSRDRFIRESISLHRGLRLIRQDPWECLVSYLCSINSNIPRIRGDVERLSRRYGKSIEFDGRSFYTFPTVDALSNADEEELRSLKTGFRAKYIVSAARRMKEEKVDLMRFRKMHYDDAFSELCTYFGIGPKVADCVLLFSMDKLESFPVDRWVRRGVEILYFAGQKLTEKKVREWSHSHFGRYAGYAQEYLFYGSRLRELAGDLRTRSASDAAGMTVLRAGSPGS